MKLSDLKPGDWFICPWREEKIPIPLQLESFTPSAAWVRIEELKEIRIRNKITGEYKVIKQRFKVNEPWSLGTEVEKYVGRIPEGNSTEDTTNSTRKRGRPKGGTKRESKNGGSSKGLQVRSTELPSNMVGQG